MSVVLSGTDRPYFQGADWLWDPIPASPVLHDKTTIWGGYLAAGQHPANLADYANAIVYLTEIDGNTPRYSVTARNAPGWGPNPFAGHQIPVPVAARSRVTPFTGDEDSWLIVADPATNKVFHLWQATWTGTTWIASWGGVSDINGDARDDITGSGLSNFGGTIRLANLQAAAAAGTGLGHALQFSSDATAGTLSSQFLYPATKTDGHLWTQVVADPIWEGARFQLDPSIDVDAISGITAAEKVIARTLQTHGAYLIDNGGARVAFMFERQTNGSITAYSALGLGWDYYDLTKIPWGSMRVLRHWHGGATLEQDAPPAPVNLYADPYFQDSSANTNRSKGGWTVTTGQAVWPGPADTSFYLNPTQEWGPAGLPGPGEYEIKVTFSGTVPTASFWATPSDAITGYSTNGQVLTGNLVVPAEGLTALALWVGGPATVTHISIADPTGAEPEEPGEPADPEVLGRPELKEVIFEFVSTTENSTLEWWTSYNYVEALSYDAAMRGYTCGIIGFTTGTFDVTYVIEEYEALKPGNQFSADFLPIMQQVDAYSDNATRGTYSMSLLDPMDYPARWIAEANDPLFRQAQRNIRDRLYWEPAFNQAVLDGVSDLGMLQYYDCVVNHGSWPGPPPGYGTFEWCRTEALKTTQLPNAGGNEAAYLNALLDARWLILGEWGDANPNGRIPALRKFITDARFDLNIPPELSWSMYGSPFSLTSQPVAGDYTPPAPEGPKFAVGNLSVARIMLGSQVVWGEPLQPPPPLNLFEEDFEGRTGLPAVGDPVTTATTGFDWVRPSPVFAVPSVSGSRSMRCAATSSDLYGQVRVDDLPGLYLRVYIQHIAGLVPAARLLSPTGQVHAYLVINENGTVRVTTSSFSTIGQASPITLASSEWARLEWESTPTTQRIRIYRGTNLHGVVPDWDSGPLARTLSNTINRVHVGLTATITAEALFDDVAINETTWPGPA